LATKLPTWNCRRNTWASHTTCGSPIQSPPPQENNPAQPLGRLTTPPQQNWKPQTASCNLTPTLEVGVEQRAHPGEHRWGKELISQCWTVRGVARNWALSQTLSDTP
jgi:hypothetical protein